MFVLDGFVLAAAAGLGRCYLEVSPERDIEIEVDDPIRGMVAVVETDRTDEAVEVTAVSLSARGEN